MTKLPEITPEDFMRHMDTQNPSWYIELANETELRDRAYQLLSGHGALVALPTLRRSVGDRLFICARATYAAMHEAETKALAKETL